MTSNFSQAELAKAYNAGNQILLAWRTAYTVKQGKSLGYWLQPLPHKRGEFTPRGTCKFITAEEFDKIMTQPTI